MNRSFLDSGRRKNNHRKKVDIVLGSGSVTGLNEIMKDDIPLVDDVVAKDVVSLSMADENVAKAKRSLFGEKTVLESYRSLPTQVTTLTGNTPGKSSYANVTGKPNGKKLNFRTLFTPGGNGIDVVVPVESIRAISERFANTIYGFYLGKRVAYLVVANYVRNTWGKYGLVRSMFSSSTELFSFQFSSMVGLDAKLENGPWFIQNNLLILKKWHPDENLLKEDVSTITVWVKLHDVPITAFSEDGLNAIATKLGRSSYARAMIELQADLELKDNIVMAMPKIAREGHYTCNIRVKYEWKPPRCASCKIFGHIHEECLKNTDVGETKTIKKPSQTSQGVLVGQKVRFKHHKEYRPVPKKPNASSNDNKKKGMEPTIEVSNSNPFEVLNSVDNDVELGTNRGTTNLVNNKANSSGSSFINVDNSSTSTTPIIDKIRKFEDLLTSGQAILMDEAGNPLKKVDFVGDYESEDEVASIDNDMARSLASERVGFGTQTLLEQWRDSYSNGDYDDDPYDDDTYEGQDLPQEIQAICDNLDI
ncbi:retrotransposon protein, putative, ty1-copia subclass [Tanacetum coccineum]